MQKNYIELTLWELISWEVDLVGVDLVGVDLVGVDLVGVDLVGVDLVGGHPATLPFFIQSWTCQNLSISQNFNINFTLTSCLVAGVN